MNKIELQELLMAVKFSGTGPVDKKEYNCYITLSLML